MKKRSLLPWLRGLVLIVLAATFLTAARPLPEFTCAPFTYSWQLRCEAKYVTPFTPTWRVFSLTRTQVANERDHDTGLVVFLNRGETMNRYAVVMEVSDSTHTIYVSRTYEYPSGQEVVTSLWQIRRK